MRDLFAHADELGPWVLTGSGRIVRGKPGDAPWCPAYWGGASPELRYPAELVP